MIRFGALRQHFIIPEKIQLIRLKASGLKKQGKKLEIRCPKLEVGHIPYQNRKDDALAILKLAKETLTLTPEIENLAIRLGASDLKPPNALHLTFNFKINYFYIPRRYLPPNW